MANIIKIDYENFFEFTRDYTYNNINNSIIFFGMNVGSGIEISSKRYLQQLKKSLEDKDITIFWMYDQGLEDKQLYDILNNIITRTNVIYSFENEPHEKNVKTLQKLKHENKIYFRMFANIHSASHLKEYDVNYLYDSVFTPIFKNIYYLKKEFNVNPIYFPFIQDRSDYMIPYHLRTNKQLLPKRICDPFTRVDKVSTIINKTDYFDDLKLIHKIEDENKLEELKELTDKPVKHLKNYAPEEVGVIYNQFQYFLHFPKQELFGIFSIDQMQNGVFPIQELPLQDSNNDFGLLEIFGRHGVWFKEYNSEKQNLENLKYFINQDEKVLLELQYKMINDIYNMFSEEKQINMFKKIL